MKFPVFASLLLALPMAAGAQESLSLDDMIAPGGVTLSVALGEGAPRSGSDRIRIAVPGSGPDDATGGEVVVPLEGPAQIDAPIAEGAWELRYVAEGEEGAIVLGAASLTVVNEEYKREGRGLAPRR